MECGQVVESERGTWTVPVHQATASRLVHAIDPGLPFTVVEGHSPVRPGWHEIALPLTAAAASVAVRRVRTLRYDLLLPPDEILEVGAQLEEADQGWLYLWQSRRRPPQHLSLSEKSGSALVDAMRGADVSLVIDLPHHLETAVLLSLQRSVLVEALERLGQIA